MAGPERSCHVAIFVPPSFCSLLFTALTGLAYPLAVTGIGQLVFPAQANGSLVVQDGRVVGSELIGQAFTSDRYLWPRPSATSAVDPADPTKTVDAPYNAAASTGSNLGPTSSKLADRLTAVLRDLAAGRPGAANPG